MLRTEEFFLFFARNPERNYHHARPHCPGNTSRPCRDLATGTVNPHTAASVIAKRHDTDDQTDLRGKDDAGKRTTSSPS
jgi:hypothetical protein